jgi:hypothetical protein
MLAQIIYLASTTVAFRHVVSPAPAFRALFTLAASKGRKAGA